MNITQNLISLVCFFPESAANELNWSESVVFLFFFIFLAFCFYADCREKALWVIKHLNRLNFCKSFSIQIIRPQTKNYIIWNTFPLYGVCAFISPWKWNVAASVAVQINLIVLLIHRPLASLNHFERYACRLHIL